MCCARAPATHPCAKPVADFAFFGAMLASATMSTAPWPRLLRATALLAAVVAALLTVPRVVAGRSANAWFDGDLATQDALARHVARATLSQREPVLYATGEDRFDGQTAVAFYQMTLLGLGQILLDHPERRDDYLPAMRLAAARLASPELLRYARHVFRRRGGGEIEPGEGRAYLGYVNLGLGMLRLVEPQNDLAALHDRLTAQLARELDASPTGLIETYPGETWPPDVSAVAGSIGLHGHATGVDHAALLQRWTARFEACAMDRAGMLVQRVASGTCKAVDAPRGSGTALAAYFAAFATPALSRRLYDGLSRGRRSIAGFGGIREYEAGFDGAGDLDAGPIVFGLSVGASGFGLGAARIHGDRPAFVELYRSVHLLGVPVSVDDGTTFATGGRLGNALLLAMLTARAP
jgi:hypothetical protein